MKCANCSKTMKHHKDLSFNGHNISGWKCSCGQIYYDSDSAQKILLLNKLKQQRIKARLGRIRSNLILRIPKDIETTFGLDKGKDVLIEVDEKGIRVALG